MRRTETTEKTERTESERRGGAVASVLCVLSVLSSCARIEPPPGGPPDTSPPQLISTVPESLADVPGFKGDVVFRFDEVVSEGGTPSQGAGTGDLEKLILLSPTSRVPDVTWRRDRITVKPTEGWRPNRVYRVELRPGIADLRRNQSKRGTVLTFTTGGPKPSVTIEGTVVDWTTSRPAAAALVEALLLPDSLDYRGLADSSGHIALGPLPAGSYLVRGVIDQNQNNTFDPREAFDTVRLAPGKTSAGELWAFVHDTTPPRIREITVADSMAASVALSQTLDPAQRLALSAVTVRVLPDSTPVRVTSILPKPVDDSLHRAAEPVRDTTADTTAQARPGITEAPAPRAPGARRPAGQVEALTTRPPLTDQLVVRVAQPWKPGSRYEVEIRGVRNTTGVRADVRGGFAAPKAAPPDTTRAGADSTGRAARRRGSAADSLKRPPDSLRHAVPPKAP
jgi:hypothetical protein